MCFDLTVLDSDAQYLHCGVYEKGTLRWCLTTVYGSPSVYARSSFREQLGDIDVSMIVHWVNVGVFNDVLYSYERSKGTISFSN